MHKSRRFGIPGIDRTHEVKRNYDPRHNACNSATGKSCPVCFLSVLVVQFLHHDAKEVYGSVNCEDQDSSSKIPKPDQHTNQNYH